MVFLRVYPCFALGEANQSIDLVEKLIVRVEVPARAIVKGNVQIFSDVVLRECEAALELYSNNLPSSHVAGEKICRLRIVEQPLSLETKVTKDTTDFLEVDCLNRL